MASYTLHIEFLNVFRTDAVTYAFFRAADTNVPANVRNVFSAVATQSAAYQRDDTVTFARTTTAYVGDDDATTAAGAWVTALSGLIAGAPNESARQLLVAMLWAFPAANGTPGPRGPEGPAGPVGPQGVAGPAGAVGPQGPQGNVGATGASGAAGATGAQGPSGPQGAVGPTGPQGNAGPAGPAGTTGAIGPKGTVWYSGNGAPATGSYAAGDLYLDLLTGDVYTWTSA